MKEPDSTYMIKQQSEQPESAPNTPDSGADDVARYAQEFVEDRSSEGNGHLKGAAIKAYASETRQARADELVMKFLPLVHKIVHQVVSYLRPPLSKEDLISAGTIGLIKAARDFDPTQQAEFKTYAYIRVRGAVIDELRGWSFAPAGLKKQLDEARRTLREMTQASGYMPSDEELAERLGMSVGKMYRMFENARARHFLSIHGISDESPALGESLVADGTAQPGDRLEREELLERLTKAIEELPARQREIVILYYSKELTMKTIADVLKVTESRVSQLHAGALFKLSVKLKQFADATI